MPGPSEQRHGSRWAVPAVGAGAAAVAVAVRLPHVYSLALSEDEVASARILREPSLGSMLGRVARTESTPPLWYALGWVVHHAGLSIDGVRLLSVASGALLAAGVVAIARQLLPLRFAAVAGLLVAVGSEFAFHGYELRAYELFALLTAVFALALGRVAAGARAAERRVPRRGGDRRAAHALLLRVHRGGRALLAVARAAGARDSAAFNRLDRRRGGRVCAVAAVLRQAVPDQPLLVDRAVPAARDARHAAAAVHARGHAWSFRAPRPARVSRARRRRGRRARAHVSRRAGSVRCWRLGRSSSARRRGRQACGSSRCGT